MYATHSRALWLKLCVIGLATKLIQIKWIVLLDILHDDMLNVTANIRSDQPYTSVVSILKITGLRSYL